jgi:hypothetical protein
MVSSVLLLSTAVIFIALTVSTLQAVNSQLMTGMTNDTSQQHAAHTIDNLIASEHIPLNGKLPVEDYMLLTDITPFETSVEAHSHAALKIPCSEDGMPKATLAAGVAPKLTELNLGSPIVNGTLNGGKLSLSVKGQSCLFHSDLPTGITDVVLINTSNETLDFDSGKYSVTISIHATAIQHNGPSNLKKVISTLKSIER